jgi:biofilm PGA synthesis N-glycosyltransferase PgaC
MILREVVSSPSSLFFWLSVGFIFYTYFLYPLLAASWAHLFPRPVHRMSGCRPHLSVVVATCNEGSLLEARIRNLLSQDYPPECLEIIVVSDGSVDSTGEILNRMTRDHGQIHPLIFQENRGKAAALNDGVERATGGIVVFADARQAFQPDVLARLAENFADPRVGSASGELVLIDNASGVAQQVGLYWNYEKWIRRSESTAGSMLGATGAIYAIRRSLWSPLPPGTILDDFLTPMRIVLKGYRAIFDDRAVATDRTSQHAGQERIRKQRTLAGNFQAFALQPGLLLPWRNPRTFFQVWSHKVFRLLVPWAMILTLVSSMLAPGHGYLLAVVAQSLFYGLALLGWMLERHGRSITFRLVSLAYTFISLNISAICGLWFWISGKGADQVWKKTGHPQAG